LKRWFFSLSILALVVACNSTKVVELPDAERDALNQRVLQECLDQGANRSLAFKARSGALFPSATSFGRNAAYEFKYTKTGDTNPAIREVIRVWKSTSTAIYLFITSTQLSTERKYFLRLPLAAGTPGSNEDLIDDLLFQGCIPLASDRETNYTVLSGGDSGPIVASKNYVTINPSDSTSKVYVETYTFNFDYPAWVGMYNKQVNITNRDANQNPTGTNEEYKSTFAVLGGQLNLEDSYAHPNYRNTDNNLRFCEIPVPTADTTYPVLVYKLPFMLPPDTNNCASDYTTVQATWTDFPI